MNLVDATLRRHRRCLRGSRSPTSAFRCRPRSSPSARPLQGYVDRSSCSASGPEDMEDASLVSDAPADRRIRAEVELREALGSDVLVHFRVAAPPAMTDDAQELAADAGAEVLERVEQQARSESMVVARLNPRTTAAKGETVELVVDTHRLHFFDPGDGAGIYTVRGNQQMRYGRRRVTALAVAGAAGARRLQQRRR